MALLIMAGLFFLLCGNQVLQSVIVYCNYRQTDGTVTGFEVARDRKGTTSTTPVITFQVGGKAYTAHGQNSMGWLYGRHQRGEVVKVRYQPGDPTSAVIDSFSERWLLAIITGFLGVLALGGWGVLWFIGRRNPPAPASVPAPLAESGQLTSQPARS